MHEFRPQSFLVRIVNTQNTTWQGKVTWVEGNQSQDFRSALELIKLIDGTLEQGNRPNEDTE